MMAQSQPVGPRMQQHVAVPGPVVNWRRAMPPIRPQGDPSSSVNAVIWWLKRAGEVLTVPPAEAPAAA